MNTRWNHRIGVIIFMVAALVSSHLASAQAVEVEDLDKSSESTSSENQSGRMKAAPYFKKRQSKSQTKLTAGSEGAPRYLAIHLGRMFADQAYKWGSSDQTDIGRLNAGVTYRVGEWINSMDLAVRFEYTNYNLVENTARKVSVGGIVTFPDANSRFPLYFGAGLGAGIFIKQLPAESLLALDYQVIAGARFLDVYENLGFLLETGIKNHMFLLSDGQYNGVFVNVGTVFAF